MMDILTLTGLVVAGTQTVKGWVNQRTKGKVKIGGISAIGISALVSVGVAIYSEAAKPNPEGGDPTIDLSVLTPVKVVGKSIILFWFANGGYDLLKQIGKG